MNLKLPLCEPANWYDIYIYSMYGTPFSIKLIPVVFEVGMLRAITNFPPIRETVKTILLEQDSPYHKKDDGLFSYPPAPTSKDGVLVS